MWVESEPGGRWIWTSSGTHLLVYRSADISAATAHRQGGGQQAGIVGLDLGSVLPSGAVTGATFPQRRSPGDHAASPVPESGRHL
jgi:hypothetical protein